VGRCDIASTRAPVAFVGARAQEQVTAVPFARFFGRPELATTIAVAGTASLVATGFNSTNSTPFNVASDVARRSTWRRKP
jgi:hypothetical protein